MDRSRRYEDRGRPFGGDAYRPSRVVSRIDSFRSRPSPQRARSPAVDSYIPSDNRGPVRQRSRSPNDFRRRSRSPPGRGGYRGRGAPYRGEDLMTQHRYSPRRDDRQRYEPRRSRSPPPLKREREPSSYRNRDMRSSPPAKRGRLASPPRNYYDRPDSMQRRRETGGLPEPVYRDFEPRSNYRPRSRSPPARRDTFTENNWRHHSVSPRPLARNAEQFSGQESIVTSRRSSPPVHQERSAGGRIVSERSSPTRGYVPEPYGYQSVPRSPSWRERSPNRLIARDAPPQHEDYSSLEPAPVSLSRDARYDSPPQNNFSDEPRNGINRDNQPLSQGGPSYRNDNYEIPRGLGAAPSAPRNFRPMASAPTGPIQGSVPMSAHNRPSGNSILTAPTRPRGGPFHEDRGGRPYYPSRGRGGFHGGPYRSTSFDRPAPGGLRTGPGFHGPPFRSRNSTSTTYPQTKRFNNPPKHLSDLTAIVPGGKAFPSGLPQETEKRLAQLEIDKVKLMESIEEKQKAKRVGLREWERLESESARDELKSELAEQQLDRMASDGSIGNTAF